MKTENRIILSSIALGVGLCVADFLFDYLFSYEGQSVGQLLTDISSHEIYIRLLIILSFAIFGFVCSKLILKLKKSEEELNSSLFFQQQLLESIPLPIF